MVEKSYSDVIITLNIFVSIFIESIALHLLRVSGGGLRVLLFILFILLLLLLLLLFLFLLLLLLLL